MSSHNQCPRLQKSDLAWIVLFALFSTIILFSGRSTPLVFDAARHALIARNVVEGHGFVVSYPSGNTPLTITSTGPSLILPGAAIMTMTGNTYWFPAFSAAIWHCVLLGILLFNIRRLMLSGRQLFPFAALLLFLFLWYEPIWWTYFIGEASSLLLALIAICIASKPGVLSRKDYFWTGFIASLAVLSRPMVLPALTGIACLIMIRQYTLPQSMRPRLATIITTGLSGFISAQIPFRIYEAWSISLFGDVNYTQFWSVFLQAYSSTSALGIHGLPETHGVTGKFLGNVRDNYLLFSSIMTDYGINPLTGICIWLMLMLAAIYRAFQPRLPTDHLLGCIGLSTFFYTLWFFFLCQSSGMERYFIHLAWLLCFLLSLTATRALPVTNAALLACLLLLITPAAPKQVLHELLTLDDISWVNGRSADYNSAVIRTRDFIASHEFRYPLANCGWLTSTPELELTLPQTGNFNDCYQLIEQALTPLPDGNFSWKHPVNFTLVINKYNWHFAKSITANKVRHRALMQACSPTTIHDSELYRIMDCPFEALEASIPLDASTPFVGSPEEWLGSHPG